MKAIALISGGLDSILAARLIKELGIDIVPLNFKIPFCHRDKKSPFKAGDLSCWVTNNLSAELRISDISSDFLKLLEDPKHGFGANMNPCIDCRILMLSKTRELMKQLEARFVVTGEVLGQRPMSQHRQALNLIEKEAGLEGLVIRPLSAQLLPETIPEKEGWVARSKLLGFSGRTRRPQMYLAGDFHIEDYPNASGGCLLTDPEFSARLKDLISHQELNMDNVELLKLGRHFRLTAEAKLIVGRDEKENEQLVNLAKENDYLFFPPDELAGPTSLGRGLFNQELIKLSCSLTCRYCDLNGSGSADIVYKLFSEKEYRILNVSPIEDAKLTTLRL